MIHPLHLKKVVKAKFSGETVNGKPHGLGEYRTEDGARGFGEFEDGQLHGQAVHIDESGWRGSFTYRQGIREGFAK